VALAVPSYLVAKSIGAGIFIVSAAGVALGWLPLTPFFTTLATLIALIFIGINTGLLVWDLDRPDRFWTILIRPQWRSWLARGAFILVGFSIVGGLYFIGQLVNLPISNLLIWPGVILAALSATYTAFLFAQAEGRDLWQSTLLPWHMFVQALMAGSALMLIAGALTGLSANATHVLSSVFGVSVIINLLITIGGEYAVPHASQVAVLAVHSITHGRYARWYWSSIIGGLVFPLVMSVLVNTPIGLAAAGVLSLLGLFAYEWAFVMAPQDIPNN
jgi:formate-dependent nitrite reductase membrane component NrfD